MCTRTSDRDAIFSISERLHKKIASLRSGTELVLLRSKRREKRYDCRTLVCDIAIFVRKRDVKLQLTNCRTLRLRSATRYFRSLRRERLLYAKIAAENQRNRGRGELDCYCRIAQT